MAFPVPLVTVLYQRLCSEPARQESIDALLRAISAPFEPGESERARVDALLLLIEDSVIGGLQGSDQRRVDVTALHTLLFMSNAYARDLSERGQELLRHFPLSPALLAAQQFRTSVPTPTWQRIAAGAAVSCGFYEIFAALTWPEEMSFMSLILPLGTLLTLILPGLRMTRPRQSLRDGAVRGVFCALLLSSIGVLATCLFGTLLFAGDIQSAPDKWFWPLFLMGMGMVARGLVFLLLVLPRRAGGGAAPPGGVMLS